MQKAVFPINSHADITKAISFMHTNYTKALEEKKPLVAMDVIEARRNLKRYQTNVSALQQVHPQDLSIDELNTITVIIKKQNRLINNIEESLQECKHR